MMDSSGLVEIDSLEAVIIIDNELDVMSWIQPDTVKVSGRWEDVALSQPEDTKARGEAKREIPMESICCGAHGLSILLTATKEEVKHSMLFDIGPEEDAWERNAKRLGVDLASIEMIHLSHWHRDHSGGMLRAINMITSAKKSLSGSPKPLTIDLHPSRPDYRGFTVRGESVSLQADPSFEEIENAGATVHRSSEAHAVLNNMFLISGHIPAVTTYETGLRHGIRFWKEQGKWEKDEEISDERFLMCNVKGKGIVIFTGCSHRGVINASKEAINLLGGNVPLHAVVGGYHLAGSNDTLVKDTVKDFKSLNPKVLLPGHCSGWRVKFEIEKEMPGCLVPCSVGHKISF